MILNFGEQVYETLWTLRHDRAGNDVRLGLLGAREKDRKPGSDTAELAGPGASGNSTGEGGRISEVINQNRAGLRPLGGPQLLD